MPATYEMIATRAFSAGAINFTSIPQTYTDLVISLQMRGVNAGSVEYLLAQFNGSTTGHSWTYLLGNGSAASAARNSPGGIAPAFFYVGLMPGGTATSGLYSTVTMNIPNYANTSTYKNALWRFGANNGGSSSTNLSTGLFSSTAAITSILLAGSNGSDGSATLYGIKAA